jgi:hypothetical protein
VALQGTFDTFALADVLRLLGGTGKSGQLHITGAGPEGAVTGDIWLEGGRLVDIDTPEPAGSLAEGLFQMLRVEGGSFSFDPQGRSDSELAADVGDVIGDAQEMLGEWTDVRRSLPSLDHDLMLVEALDSDTVTLSAAQWSAVVAVAADRSARAVADRLKLGAIGLGRIVRDLRELGVVHVSMDAADEPIDPPALLPQLRLSWSDDVLAADEELAPHLPAASEAVVDAVEAPASALEPSEPVVAPEARPVELGDLTSTDVAPVDPAADRLTMTGRFSLFASPSDEDQASGHGGPAEPAVAAGPQGPDATTNGEAAETDPVAARDDEFEAAFAASPPPPPPRVPDRRRMRLRAVRS